MAAAWVAITAVLAVAASEEGEEALGRGAVVFLVAEVVLGGAAPRETGRMRPNSTPT
jgi:ribose/xylose/arabinose/galactoside ABC-type transport system permease subunit